LKSDHNITAAGETRNLHSIFIWAVFFVLIIFKGIDRLLHAGIWAEDGKVFLKQAFELGWSSLLVPYDGYFHSLPRLIAGAVSWMPVAFMPTALVLICYAIFAYAIALICTKPYRWLFPHKGFAFVCALLLLLSPGQHVMLGNTANLHWYLLLILAVYGLKDIDESYTVPELAVAFLCVASEGASLIVLPLFLTRVGLKKHRGQSDCRGEYLILLFIVVFALIHLYGAQPAQPGRAEFALYPALFINHLYYFFTLHLFTGDALLSIIPQYKVMLKLTAFVLILCLIFWFSKRWRADYLLIIVVSLSSLFLPVLIAAVRPQNLSILTDYYQYDAYAWFRFRYSFFIPAIASIFWCFVISRITRPHWLPALLFAIILSVQIYGGRDRFAIGRYKEISDWYQQAPLLERSLDQGCPPSVQVRISPPGWFVDFTSPVTAVCEQQSNQPD